MFTMKICDRKLVMLLSTMHNATLQSTGRVDRNPDEPIKKLKWCWPITSTWVEWT